MEQITWTKVEKRILKSNTGKYRARITKTMPDGSTKQFCRDARTLDDARANLKELKGEFKGVTRGDDTERIQNKIKGRRMRFRDLARIFESKKLQPPVYDDPNSDKRQKQKGLVRYEDSQRFLNTLVSRFGGMLLSGMRHDHIETFKLDRLREPKRGGGRRSIASVHRELQVMQAVLAYAVRKGYLQASPFVGDGDSAPLIKKSQENERERVLSLEEETRMLNELTSGPTKPIRQDREHLRKTLIFLLQTACRHNELKQLERRDIDPTVEDGIYGKISIRGCTTKTGRPKMVPIFTRRLRQILEERLAVMSDDPRALVFDKSSVKKALSSAMQRAGITDFTIHDCRHTAITRWIESGMSAEQAMKYAGIKSHAVFQRYLNLSRIAHRKNAKRIGAYYAENLVTTDVLTSTEAIN
jgi:integrase